MNRDDCEDKVGAKNIVEQVIMKWLRGSHAREGGRALHTKRQHADRSTDAENTNGENVHNRVGGRAEREKRQEADLSADAEDSDGQNVCDLDGSKAQREKRQEADRSVDPEHSDGHHSDGENDDILM